MICPKLFMDTYAVSYVDFVGEFLTYQRSSSRDYTVAPCFPGFPSTTGLRTTYYDCVFTKTYFPYFKKGDKCDRVVVDLYDHTVAIYHGDMCTEISVCELVSTSSSQLISV